MRISAYLTAALLPVSLSAVAQIRVCVAGNLDSLSPAQIAACEAKSASLRHEARVIGTQGDWRVVMVCDEAGWKEYAAFPGNDRDTVMHSVKHTDQAAHIVFVRGSKLQQENTRDLDLLLASVVDKFPARVHPAAKPATTRDTSFLMAQR